MRRKPKEETSTGALIPWGGAVVQVPSRVDRLEVTKLSVTTKSHADRDVKVAFKWN